MIQLKQRDLTKKSSVSNILPSLQLMSRVLPKRNSCFYFNVAQTCSKFHIWELWFSLETIKGSNTIQELTKVKEIDNSKIAQFQSSYLQYNESGGCLRLSNHKKGPNSIFIVESIVKAVNNYNESNTEFDGNRKSNNANRQKS